MDPKLTTPEDIVRELETGDVRVLGMPFSSTNFRLAFHLDISDQLASLATEKMALIVRKYVGK